jgi:hypothetical protein
MSLFDRLADVREWFMSFFITPPRELDLSELERGDLVKVTTANESVYWLAIVDPDEDPMRALVALQDQNGKFREPTLFLVYLPTRRRSVHRPVIQEGSDMLADRIEFDQMIRTSEVRNWEVTKGSERARQMIRAVEDRGVRDS